MMSLNGVQIGILIVAGVLLLLFLKYKITGTLRPELDRLGEILHDGYEVFGILAMIGALAGLLAAVMIVYSVFAPPDGTLDVTVRAKSDKYLGTRHGHSYTLLLGGDAPRQSVLVSHRLYRAVQTGDRLHVTLSRYFRDWREVSVFRGDQAVARFDETEWGGALFVAALCLLPMWVFRLFVRLRDRRTWGSVVFLLLLLVSLVPIALLLRR